jgi:acetyl esterase/lipase
MIPTGTFMKITRILFLSLIAVLVFSNLPLFGQTITETDSIMILPPGCTVQENLVYKTVGDWKGLLDLYLPADQSSTVPLVLMFHGGGWNHGKKEDVQKGALTFLKYGWAVANIEYRLLAVAPAPAALEDARCALLWLVDNSEKYKFDVDHIITTGSSAGGHLALMTGLLPDVNQFDKDCIKEKHFKIIVIINKYGVTDVTAWLGRTLWLDNVPNRAELAKAVSPLTYIRPNIPPIITVHGDADPTVPYEQAVRLHQMLDSLNVKNVFYTVHGGKHGKFEKEENRKFGEMTKQFLIELGLSVKTKKRQE